MPPEGEYHAVTMQHRPHDRPLAAPSLRLPVFASLTAGRQAAAAEPELPLLHRLAVVYLMLPVVVWLVGWFEWWLGLPAAALLVGALRRPLSGPWRLRAPTPAEAAVLAVAALWVLATAAGGVFDPRNIDFFSYQVILLDLGRHPWPTYLPDPLAAWRPAPAEGPPATPPLLRYYLGWHMVPGLAAHWLGPAALSWAVAVWTWAGVALVALLFTHCRHGGGRRRRELVVALAVLVFFSGVAFAGLPAIERWERVDWMIENRNWYGFLTYEPAFLRAISATVSLKMVPHHFLPAGLYALLCLHLRRQPRFLAVLGVLLAAAPFWSAFVAVGLLPLLAVVLWMNGVRPFLRWPNLCLAGPLFGVVVLYLTSGAMDFPQGWMWQREGYDWPRLMRRLLFFYLSEFLLLAVLLAVVRPALRREPFFIAAVAALLLLPVYYYGDANDLQMRASQPALFVLSWLCARAVVRRGGAIVRCGGVARRAAFGGLMLVLGTGAVTPVAELARAADGYGWFRYEHAGHTTLVDLNAVWRRQNVARDVPDLLRWLLREPGIVHERRTPGKRLVRSDFDVYLDGGTLIYVKERCTPADVDGNTILFLRVAPADPADLPRRHRRSGFVPYHPWSLVPWPSKVLGGRCLFGVSLPEYPVARIVVGQRTPGKRAERRILWKAEVAFPADAVPSPGRYRHEPHPDAHRTERGSGGLGDGAVPHDAVSEDAKRRAGEVTGRQARILRAARTASPVPQGPRTPSPAPAAPRANALAPGRPHRRRTSAGTERPPAGAQAARRPRAPSTAWRPSSMV